MPGIDFTQVQDLEPVPNGAYSAEIVHAEAGMSKTQNPKIDLRWKITDGEFEGRQIFDSMSFHPNALFRTKAVLKALGWKDGFSGEVNAGDLVGLTATVVVSIEESTQNDPATGDPYPPRNRVIKVKQGSASALEGLLSK